MNNFFSHTDQLTALQSIAQSWLGTPFAPHGKVKKAGVDCVHIAAEIYRECGLFETYEFPTYTLDGGHHAGTSKIIGWVEQSGHFEKINIPAARETVGDLVCFKIGGTEWHVGVMVTGKTFLHCWKRYGVMLSRIDDPSYGDRLTTVYRPIVKGVL